MYDRQAALLNIISLILSIPISDMGLMGFSSSRENSRLKGSLLNSSARNENMLTAAVAHQPVSVATDTGSYAFSSIFKRYLLW